MRTVLVCLVALAVLIPVPSTVRGQSPGFGFDAGRASPSDVAQLARDIARVIIAERLLAGELSNTPTDAPNRQVIIEALRN